MEQTCANGESALAVAIDAYIYAFPLVLLDATMKKFTNVPEADRRVNMAPMNQFVSAIELQTATSRDVGRPNVDTLYSTAWLDLRTEPIIFSLPDTQGRYYVMQMVDMWTDVFAAPGKRTTGTQAKNFAVLSPTWQGALPAEVEMLRAPTDRVWIIGRTQTNGTADYDNVHQVQSGYRLTPLSRWGTPYTPPNNTQIDPTIDMSKTPYEVVLAMDGPTFFARFADLLAQYAPHPVDYPILHRMQCLGIVSGQPFDVNALDASMLTQAVQEAQGRIRYKAEHAGITVNNWVMSLESAGTYGSSYLQRATLAYLGAPYNLPEDAIYPMTFLDADNQPLTGKNAYCLHLEKAQIPSVNAFWSVTLYDEHGYLVDNPLNRYALGDRDPLQYNADGSLDIYLQQTSPGKEKEANWLPTPTGPFNLTIRMYWPKADVLLGNWHPASVRNLGEQQQLQRPAA